MPSNTVRIKLSGEFACFTRPEAKVERASYALPTPSAARNILASICWKPEMRWVVTSIALLKPVKYMSIRRNEVQSKPSPFWPTFVSSTDDDARCIAAPAKFVARDA